LPLAEPVGFEFYFRDHLSRDSLDFSDKSANIRPGDYIETRSELCGCGQTVGRRTFSRNPVVKLDRTLIISKSRENRTRNAPQAPAPFGDWDTERMSGSNGIMPATVQDPTVKDVRQFYADLALILPGL
jgi:hypothetical protein